MRYRITAHGRASMDDQLLALLDRCKQAHGAYAAAYMEWRSIQAIINEKDKIFRESTEARDAAKKALMDYLSPPLRDPLGARE